MSFTNENVNPTPRKRFYPGALLSGDSYFINPELATVLRLPEAMVLQQIHYWLEKNRETGTNFINGRNWVFQTYKQWNDKFFFWSIRTIKSAVIELELLEILISANFNKKPYNRTKWYTIDYKKLNSFYAAKLGLSYDTGLNDYQDASMSELFFANNNLLFTSKKAIQITGGLTEALVLQYINTQVRRNESSGRNFKDGFYWMFDSVAEMQKSFPFISSATIVRILQYLEDEHFILTGIYNKASFDRTKWYTINEELIEEKSANYNPGNASKLQNDLINFSDDGEHQ